MQEGDDGCAGGGQSLRHAVGRAAVLEHHLRQERAAFWTGERRTSKHCEPPQKPERRRNLVSPSGVSILSWLHLFRTRTGSIERAHPSCCSPQTVFALQPPPARCSPRQVCSSGPGSAASAREQRPRQSERAERGAHSDQLHAETHRVSHTKGQRSRECKMENRKA